MVVESVVPSTRTLSPLVRALAEVEPVPSQGLRGRVLVDGYLLTSRGRQRKARRGRIADRAVCSSRGRSGPSIGWLAAGSCTACGPSRSCTAAAPPGKWVAVVAEFDGVVVEPDAAKPTEMPVAANASAAPEIHRLLRLDSHRRAPRPATGNGFGWACWLVIVHDGTPRLGSYQELRSFSLATIVASRVCAFPLTHLQVSSRFAPAFPQVLQSWS